MQPCDSVTAWASVADVEDVVSVVEALERDMQAIRRVAPDIADSALAASARALAVELDDPGTSATAKSMCQRALRETLDRLRELAPQERTADGIDDLTRRRASRRAAPAS